MSTQNTEPAAKLTKKDFTSDQEVRWCPGCGDYAILSQIQKTLPEARGRAREHSVRHRASAARAASRTTWRPTGSTSIHGRALTLASGVRIANPDLSVWVITGDGDGLSIGGNHFLHTLRRNFDINVVLFNNRIYGLTKGQYSPTSRAGQGHQVVAGRRDRPPDQPGRARRSPPRRPMSGAPSTPTRSTCRACSSGWPKHKGIGFLEIFQNCNIFNDGAFDGLHGPEGAGGPDGLPGARQAADLRQGGRTRASGSTGSGRKSSRSARTGSPRATCSCGTRRIPTLAYLISNLDLPEFPVPVGTFMEISRPTYEDTLQDQIAKARKRTGGDGDMQALIAGTNTWTVG